MVWIILRWGATGEALDVTLLEFVRGEESEEILTFPSEEVANDFIEGLMRIDEEERALGGRDEVLAYKAVEIPYWRYKRQ